MPRFIPDDVLDQIRLRADIVDVVQSYVPTMKKNGATWKACCPFHQEKTPSFVVNPARQGFKCFGCGKGGNVFTFVMEMEKLDFPNAAELLARKYGVIIPDPEPYRGGTRAGNRPGQPNAYSKEKAEKDYNLRERLYRLHERLAEFYMRQLRDPERGNRNVADYFKTRAIPSDAADRFMIGAAPDSWDAGILFAKRDGFTEEELRLSGVVSEKEEKPDHIYDRFRNRLMFPIWNEQGRIVAFSARSIEADPKGWKYVNSPESPVFKKSRTLYALHFARSAIAETKTAVLCEGQLDVIAMHRAGCSNAVAPQGTAFGMEQAMILKRYTRTICLALDNDKAGQAAVFKDAVILLPLGFTLKVAVFPGAKDADELLKTQGPEPLRACVENAVDFFDFAYEIAVASGDLASPAGKSAIAEELLRSIRLIDNAVTREFYMDWLARKLNISLEVLKIDTEHQLLLEKQKENYDQQRRTLREEEQKKREQESASETCDETSSADTPPDTNELEGGASPRTERRKTDASRPLPPRSERNPGLKKAFAELFDVLIEHEDYAEKASREIEREMLDDSPLGHAIEIIIQSKINEEWEDAPSRIMMLFAKDNIDISTLPASLTALGEVLPEDDEAGETEANADDGNDASAPPAPDPQQEADRKKKQKEEMEFVKNTYLDCVRVILKAYYTDRKAILLRRLMAMPDSPEKLQMAGELLDLSKKLLNLPKRRNY